MRRHSIKPGRGPSAVGAVVGVAVALFGVFWTVMAFSLTADAPGPVSFVFPLFGIIFVLLAIGGVIYNLHNATQPHRFSDFDIVPSAEEPDPLARTSPTPSARPDDKFCRRCGAGVDEADHFCGRCGQPARSD